MRQLCSSLIFIFVLAGLLLISSCTKDDPSKSIPFAANAGPDQTVAPFTLVTLDGSASTGAGNINYEWLYTGPATESEIGLFNKNSQVITFTPTKNGSYSFTLRITADGKFNEDGVIVIVSGVITLGGTITENIILKDIEPDPTKPDYKVTSDLKVLSGKTITTEDKSGLILVEMSETAGIMVDGGSIFKNSTNMQLTFTSPTGWKGFVLAGGSLNLNTGTRIEKAAKAVFSSGQTEPAAITAYAGGNLSLTGVNFSGNTGYELLIPDHRTGTTSVESNVFSAAKPIKMPISMLGVINFNSFGTPYDYVVLTTQGAGILSTTPGGIFRFRSNSKYYIDGDFTASSNITIDQNSTIYMKAGAGILSSSNGITASGATIDGINGAAWKGIAVGAGSSASLSNTIIKNAGSDLFTGLFASTQKAAVYYASTSNNGTLNSCTIIDSKGYGMYIDTTPGLYMSCSNTTFTNPTNSAISAPINVVHTAISIAGASNTYTMPANVAAVEVRSPNPTSTQPGGNWKALGGTNAYLIAGNVFADASWTLEAGVNLKFKSTKSLDIRGGTFTAIGTAGSPITFDSESGIAGSWPGIVVESSYKLEYCQFKNGGESFLFKGGITSATEKANVVFNNTVNASNSFKNNTVSGGGGYGILVETGKQNPDALNVANANAFSTNTLGNVIIK